MKNDKEMNVVLRPKRQVTLPREICERMGIRSGDVLELTIEDSKLVAKPRKTRSLEALKEIRKIFEKSGIAEVELQKAGKRVRREIVRDSYGRKA